MSIENNKIIAEFMGLRPKCEMDGVYSYSDMPFYSIRENDIDKVIQGIAKYSKYNSDWNWLMEVVEKIESLGYSVEMNKQEENDYQCLIIKNDIITQVFSNTKIEAVYNACVEFIKWHNEQIN